MPDSSLAAHGSSLLWSTLNLARSTLRSSSRLITIPFNTLLYIAAPVLVLASIFFEYFIRLPYSFIKGAFDALYPLYVFTASVTIIAVLVGFSAKWITAWVQESLLVPAPPAVQRAPTEPKPPAYSQWVFILADFIP